MTGVCVSLIASQTPDLLRDLSAAEELADVIEIRGDRGPLLDLRQIRAASSKALLYTCRSASQGGALGDDDSLRVSLLEKAIVAGFDYIDVELDSLPAMAGVVAGREGAAVVVSHHDLAGTPQDLDALYARMCAAGADIVKIVTTPHSVGDVARLLAFARRTQGAGPRPLIALALGAMGQATRVLAALSGAPFTYASLRRGAEAAPGQIPAAELLDIYRIHSLSPATAVYGLVGRDVTHSLSPAIHNAACAAAGIDAVYVPFSVDDFAAFMTLADVADLSGFSVTRPFKAEALGFASAASASPAAAAGSVNTMTRRGDAWLASSTDGRGVCAPLAALRGLADARVLVLGAGGAARAAAVALTAERAAVTITARSDQKARAVAEELRVSLSSWVDRAVAHYDIVINATPAGSHEAVDETPVPAERLMADAIIFDMVYAPVETRLLRDAAAAGCRTVDGIAMLVAQAAPQFEEWHARAAPVAAMERAARRAAAAA